MKNTIILGIVIGVVAFMFGGYQVHATDVGGIIHTNTNWDLTGSPLDSIREVQIATIATEDPPVFLCKWGSYGSGDGQFSSRPTGVAVDTDGHVYVAAGNRIQKFGSEGNFRAKWGSYGEGDGQFSAPAGMAVDSGGNIYVADYNNHRIQKFDSDGNFLTKWGSYGEGDGQFIYPTGVAVDTDGNVYVAEYGNRRIQKFDSDRNFLAKCDIGGAALGVAVDADGNVYVAGGEYEYYSIQKFDSDGNFLTEWDPVHFPIRVAVDADNNVYVVIFHSDEHFIQKFDSDGNFLTEWGSYGSGDGQFIDPWSAAIDTDGNIYVADFGNYRIQKFGPPVIEVTLDIKPGSYRNSINLGSKGVVPVAVLTTDEFDASTVDPSTVEFAGASPVHSTMEDVDGDGDVDMLFHFKTQALNLTEESIQATLTGYTNGGTPIPIEGTDSVTIVPNKKGK